MRHLTVTLCAMALVAVLWASPASATPVGIGEGVGIGGSWTFSFENTTYGVSFDLIEIFITGGGARFDAPAAVSGPTEWGGVLVNPTYSYVSGPLQGANQVFSLFFFDPQPLGGIVVDFLTWSGGINGTLVPNQHWRYTNIPVGGAGGPWEFVTNIASTDYDRSVPDGGMTLAFLGAVLAGLGAMRRKLRG